MIELLSIDLSNYCSKECPFCYNHSSRTGNTMWQPSEVIQFASDCIMNGIKAVSLGGGEPFEYQGIFDVIDALYPQCYLSVTSNGMPLEDGHTWELLRLHKPDKIHITVHYPDNSREVERVKGLLPRIAALDIKPGVNLLVGADKIDKAKSVYSQLTRDLLSTNQVILVPQRFTNTPTAKQLGSVADGKPFQSPSCLLGCRRPMDFCSVSWDKKVNSCSFSPLKVPLKTLDFNGLVESLAKTVWHPCGAKAPLC